jgi:hypothetical protein
MFHIRFPEEQKGNRNPIEHRQQPTFWRSLPDGVGDW